MSNFASKQKMPKGIFLEPDLGEAIKIRKLALASGSFVESYPNSNTAMKSIRNDTVDYLLIDCCFRNIEAWDFIREVRRTDPEVMVLAILPNRADERMKRTAVRAGVWDFFIRPFGPEEFQMRLTNAMTLRRVRPTGIDAGSRHEEEIRNAISDILLREYETLHVLGRAAEYKDQETGIHILRVANYARLIAEVIGENEVKLDILFHSSALHDIGKIGIPDRILLKPGPLSDQEFRVMKSHTTNGHGILEQSESSYLLTGAMIALTHHERFDGTGYPMGLAGSEIPLYGRIVCVADVFDALTTKRPYKEPWSLDRAFGQLEERKGDQIDAYLIDAFTENALHVERIYTENRDTSDAPAAEPM